MSEYTMSRWLYIKFEQGRGKGGVPKTWVPWLMEGTETWTLDTVIKMAVAMFRVQCADSNLGHGKDLMPGSDDEYQLHNAVGGRIEKIEDIKWGATENNQTQAPLILTWKNPAELLIETAKVAQ